MANRIIIAEDSGSLRKLYVSLIRDMAKDAEIDEVSSGEDLVEKMRRGKYSLLITDNYMLGSMTGVQAMKSIREFDKDTPIYMISGSSAEELAMAAGATGYFEKENIGEIFEKGLARYLK